MSCRRRGFTLLEVLITIVLLIIGIAAIVTAMANATSADRIIESKAVAAMLAQEAMESEKDLAFTDLANVNKAEVTGFPGYWRQVVVTGIDPKTVTVNVFLTSTDVDPSVYFSTLLTNMTPG